MAHYPVYGYSFMQGLLISDVSRTTVDPNLNEARVIDCPIMSIFTFDKQILAPSAHQRRASLGNVECLVNST